MASGLNAESEHGQPRASFAASFCHSAMRRPHSPHVPQGHIFLPWSPAQVYSDGGQLRRRAMDMTEMARRIKILILALMTYLALC
jgi:hypothetical protein